MKTITVSPTDNINQIFQQANFSKLILNPGHYYFDDILKINRDNVQVIGKGKAEDIHLYQTNLDRDGLSLQGNNLTLKNISIHVTHPNRIALVTASLNNSTVERCAFYGNENYFTVYYAGPSDLAQGESTIRAYLNQQLDQGNKFENNVVYTNFSGDSVSWSLQKNSTFRNNIIRGGKLAVYMCQSSNINQNIISDSTSQGIFVSLPCQQLSIKQNQIFHCQTSALTVKPQQEHQTEIETSLTNQVDILNNLFNDNQFIGIETNSANNLTISKNQFVRNDHRAIYLQQSSNININDNLFSYFDTAIQIISSKVSEISNNQFLSIHPKETKHALELQTLDQQPNCYLRIQDNLFLGKYLNPITDLDPHDSNLIQNNQTNQYYSYQDEQRILNRKY